MAGTILQPPIGGGAGGMPRMGVEAASVNPPKIPVPDEGQKRQAKEIRAGIRAISTVDQIYAICDAMFDPNSERNLRNGIIAGQYNDNPPFTKDEHKKKGQGFRNNACTGFLSGILDQAISAPVDLIDNAQYLCSNALEAKDDPDGSKTEAFRRKVTRTIREWENWRTHCYNISQEDVVFGYNAVVNDDPDDWRPEECRQDDFGVPDNTKQHASSTQFFGRKKSIMLHDFMDKLADYDAAEAAGFKMDACIEAANESMPTTRGNESGTGTTMRSHVELVRDGNSGAAHDPKARTIDVYILLATEPNGKVSKYMVTQRGSKLLYENEDEFEKVSDVICFYSLNPGSGTLPSSKGGGRKLVNLAKSAERIRNKSLDSAILANISWMWSEKGMVAVQMKVMDQFAIIGSEAKVEKDAMPVNIEAWQFAEERVTAWAEQAFGAYIPQKLSEDDPQRDKTATEVTEEARREQMAKASWLKRFFGQFKDEMTIVVRRLCDPDTKDEVARELQKDLEENDGITPELLKKLADQPSGDLVLDLTAQTTAALLKALPMLKASQFIDQYKLEQEVFTRILGKEMVDRLYFKNGIDPARESKEINQQILETVAIMAGESPNAVPTDDHKTHSNWLIGDLKRSEPNITKAVQDGTINPKILDNVATAIKHGEGHLDYWEPIAQGSQNQDDLNEIAQHRQFYADAQQKHDEALKFLLARQQAQPPAAAQPAAAVPQAGGGQPAEAGEPQEKTWGGMTERMITAWIGQYEALKPEMRQQLEAVCGFKPEGDTGAPQGNGELPPRKDLTTQLAGSNA